MKLAFEGAAPCDDEVAAIVAVLGGSPDVRAQSRPQIPAWRLASLLPDLTIEELRAAAPAGHDVP